MNNKNRATVTVALIIINVLYFIFLTAKGGTEDAELMLKWGAAYTPYILEDHQYWRLLVSCFMHFGISHIVNNMLVLYILGDNLERALGHVKYLIFYLLCGIGANVFSMYVNINSNNYAVGAGASGAIFGVMGGLLWAVLLNRGQLEDISARQLVIMLLFSLYYGFASGGIDNAAHIGGLMIGFVLSMLMYRRRRRRSWRF